MQVIVERVNSKEEEQAVIKAVEVTDEISGAIELLEGDSKSFTVSKDGKVYIIKASAVYYIESVDKKTFVLFHEMLKVHDNQSQEDKEC